VKQIRVAVMALALLSGAALAQTAPQPPVSSLPWMTDAEITNFFKGQSIAGEYADGTTFTETYKLDGVADYNDTRWGNVLGQWSVVNNHFCTLYEHEMQGACFKGIARGSNCFEFYASTATPAETANPQGQPAWTARAWRTDKLNTCTVDSV
jgi:hypothetical protein